MKETRILVIDPNTNSRGLLVNYLRNMDFSTIEAESGMDGLNKIRQFTPDIIACDTALTDLSAEAIIKSVRQEITLAKTPIVVFGNQLDPVEMDRYLKSGANDYYGKSSQAYLGFANNIQLLLDEVNKKTAEGTKGALAVFVSAKGGVGTSSLCANIGAELSRIMTISTVALVDLVLPIGSQSLITGVNDPFNIVEVSMLDPELITTGFFQEKMIKPQNWPFHLLPGSPEPGAAGSYNVNNSNHIIQVLQKTYDYLLIDLGRSFSRISLPIIQEADVIVMVLSNDVNSVTLTKRTLDYLLKQNINPERIYPVLNRAVGLEGLSKAEAEKLLGMNIRMTVPYMMSNLTLANNQNIPISTKFPTETTNLVLKQIATELSQAAIKHKAE